MPPIKCVVSVPWLPLCAPLTRVCHLRSFYKDGSVTVSVQANVQDIVAQLDELGLKPGASSAAANAHAQLSFSQLPW